jgi:hypothetical protein
VTNVFCAFHILPASLVCIIIFLVVLLFLKIVTSQACRQNISDVIFHYHSFVTTSAASNHLCSCFTFELIIVIVVAGNYFWQWC